ncbi:MAG: hypothetical protein HYV45_03165 [Candidatus Moranbacteria bacterium]|nr:hypothetical protein [Candidatus Moranbacteria bacterium]
MQSIKGVLVGVIILSVMGAFSFFPADALAKSKKGGAKYIKYKSGTVCVSKGSNPFFEAQRSYAPTTGGQVNYSNRRCLTKNQFAKKIAKYCVVSSQNYNAKNCNKLNAAAKKAKKLKI